MNFLHIDILSLFRKPERAFLIAGLIWGVCFLLLTPVNQVPDEGNHFLRACQIAQGDFIASSNGKTLGGYLPNGIARFKNHYDSYVFDKSKRFTLNEIAKGTTPFEWRGKLSFHDFPNTALYSPVCYLPQSTGIFTARLFTNDLWSIHRMGRSFNLLFWLLCMYASIRIVPHFKWLITGISLLPMQVSQAASVSPDPVIYGIVLLFLCIVLYLYYLNDVPTLIRRARWLIPFFIVIPLCKNVYTPVLFTALLLPWKMRPVSISHWTRIGLLAFFAVMSYGAWGVVVQSLLADIHRIETIYGPGPGVPQINPAVQLQWVIWHPMAFLKICAHSVLKFTDIWYPSFIGVLGWLDIRFPRYIYTMMYLYLVVLALLQGGQANHSRLPLMALCSLSGILLFFHFFLAMYLTWCNVGDPQIENLQGRYFIPMAYLFFIALASLSNYHRPFLSAVMVLFFSHLSLFYAAFLVRQYFYAG